MSCLRIALLLLFLPSLGAANLADELGELTGYIIVSSESIDDFEGCDYGEIIQFDSRLFVTCEEYGYQYAYGANVVILVRPIGTERQFSCKMAVEDELYDVNCDDYMVQYIAVLRSFRDGGDESTSAYVSQMLQILGVQE